jgi:serine/threonine-protein kinase
MKLVNGPDLRSLLRERGALPVAEAVPILLQVGQALDAAHEKGLVHRDVKPANVMLEPHASGWHAYLADFGLAKPGETGSEHTAPGELLGTVDYMAPEQIEGRPVDGRADVYSFGCVAYKCLTDELPYPRESRMATLMAHSNAPVPAPSALVPGLPRPLNVVVSRAMEKDPDRRARSAGALMRWAAAEISEGAAASADVTEDTPTEEVLSPRRPRMGPVAAAAPAPVGAPQRGISFPAAIALNVALLAPLWALAYALGSHL